MPKLESVRTTAEAIGRIKCIRTGKEIGLLYQWDNGETQAALHEVSPAEELNYSNKLNGGNVGSKCS